MSESEPYGPSKSGRVKDVGRFTRAFFDAVHEMDHFDLERVQFLLEPMREREPLSRRVREVSEVISGSDVEIKSPNHTDSSKPVGE